MSLTMLVPTRGRPENAVRLREAVRGTMTGELAALRFLVDHDDPEREQYETRLALNTDSVPSEFRRIGPILNHYAPAYAAGVTHVGFMGDDHLPRTPGWDTELVESLGGRPGVAYGNDLIKGELLPTAVVISSDIITALGYMVPRTLEHLYLDDFWRKLGEGVGHLQYRGNVVIEHMHPTAGRSEWDATYASGNAYGQYLADSAAYTEYVTQEWPGELARLRKELGL